MGWGPCSGVCLCVTVTVTACICMCCGRSTKLHILSHLIDPFPLSGGDDAYSTDTRRWWMWPTRESQFMGGRPAALNDHAEDEEQSVDLTHRFGISHPYGLLDPATVAPRGAISCRFGRFRELYPLSSSSVGGTPEVENCCCLLGTTARELRPSKRGPAVAAGPEEWALRREQPPIRRCR